MGIKSNFHPSDERVILNYDQILSNKLDLIVRECRALTLNRHDYSLIAKSFHRFLNWSEGTRNEMNRFNWDNCVATSKEDGSICSVFYWKNKWHIQTRNSYGDGYVNNSIHTWREIFEMGLDPNKLDPVEGRNYVFELCSLYNQVVRIYKEPTCYLLTIFDGLMEWTHEAVESFSSEFSLKRPFSILCRDPFEVSSAVAEMAKDDKSFEGYVLRDCYNHRYKFKNPGYLALSHLANNGAIGSIKYIVPIVLKGEEAEIIAYFPNIEETVNKVKFHIEKILQELDNSFYCFHDVKNRRTFAEKIEKVPFKQVLFNLYGTPYNKENVRDELVKQSNNLIEYLKEKI